MNKTILSLLLSATTLSTFGQFKVQSDGKIAIQTTSTASSPISINSAGSSSYYVYCSNTGGRGGISFTATGNSSNTSVNGGAFTAVANAQAVGLRGIANSSPTSIGVMGNTNYGTKSIGILGNISNTSTGAGVYGTIYGDYGSALPTGSTYAGFFRGNVKATGSIVAGTTIQGALLGESSSSTGSSTGSQSLRTTFIIDGLSGLNVTTYQKERPAQPKDAEMIYLLDGEKEAPEMPKPDIMDEQFYEKSHFALDADRLEETFPNLVYVDKDGNKVINYMEMIPLLVQSINELSAEIAELKQPGTKTTSRSTTNIEESLTSPNKLYQNTPNPFKEQTIIRFSLADDVRDAAICIFDMTGKTIKKLSISSGMESVSVGGYELGEGMFLYSLIVNGQEIDTKKMIISK